MVIRGTSSGSLEKLQEKKSNPTETIRKQDDTVIHDAKEKLEEWARHFESLLNRPTPEKHDWENEKLEQYLSSISTTSPTTSEIEKHSVKPEKHSRQSRTIKLLGMIIFSPKCSNTAAKSSSKQ